MLHRTCDKNIAESCTLLGSILAQGKGVPADPSAAAQAFERACDQGDMMACTGLGALLMAGAGVDKNEDRALSLFIRACDANRADACFRLGAVYTLQKQDALAREMFDKACQLGDQRGCAQLQSP